MQSWCLCIIHWCQRAGKSIFKLSRDYWRPCSGCLDGQKNTFKSLKQGRAVFRLAGRTVGYVQFVEDLIKSCKITATDHYWNHLFRSQLHLRSSEINVYLLRMTARRKNANGQPLAHWQPPYTCEHGAVSQKNMHSSWWCRDKQQLWVISLYQQKKGNIAF